MTQWKKVCKNTLKTLKYQNNICLIFRCWWWFVFQIEISAHKNLPQHRDTDTNTCLLSINSSSTCPSGQLTSEFLTSVPCTYLSPFLMTYLSMELWYSFPSSLKRSQQKSHLMDGKVTTGWRWSLPSVPPNFSNTAQTADPTVTTVEVLCWGLDFCPTVCIFSSSAITELLAEHTAAVLKATFPSLL